MRLPSPDAAFLEPGPKRIAGKLGLSTVVTPLKPERASPSFFGPHHQPAFAGRVHEFLIQWRCHSLHIGALHIDDFRTSTDVQELASVGMHASTQRFVAATDKSAYSPGDLPHCYRSPRRLTSDETPGAHLPYGISAVRQRY